MTKYIDISVVNVSEAFDDLNRVGAPMQKEPDAIGWENLFHQIPQAQMEVFVCLYLGMKPKEIVSALGFDSINRFYNLNAKLKKNYHEQNWRVFEYN
jgi:hypothetical protein